MIAVDPSTRPTFDTLLHTSRGTVFPESFYSFLHNYVGSVNELSSPTRFAAAHVTPAQPPVAATTSATHSNLKGNSTAATAPGTLTTDVSSDPLPSDADHRIERLWADFESVEPYITPDAGEQTVMDVKVDYVASPGSSRPFQVSTDSLVNSQTR